jgi:hypothetical protein
MPFAIECLGYRRVLYPDIKDCAKYLLKNNLYDLIGTDLHHERHLGRLKKLAEMTKEMQLLENTILKTKFYFLIHECMKHLLLALPK